MGLSVDIGDFPAPDAGKFLRRAADERATERRPRVVVAALNRTRQGSQHRAPIRRRNSTSAAIAFSKSPRCRLSFAACARVSGSSTPVMSTSASGNASANIATKPIEPPTPISTASVPHASAYAARAAA